MSYIDILEPRTGKLLFRFDPERDIIEVQRRGIKTVVDLNRFRAAETNFSIGEIESCSLVAIRACVDGRNVIVPISRGAIEKVMALVEGLQVDE